MNIVSTMVGITIMGAAAPSVMQMTLAPVEAQARARNFSTAEAAAVTYAAANEGKETKAATLPENCTEVTTGEGAWDVTCRGGESDSNYRQEVTRSYRLIPPSTSYTNPMRAFAYEAPGKYSHVECPVNDPWGVAWYNEHLKAGHLGACIPAPVWNEDRYRESSPDDWLYDLSDYGYGRHPDF